MTASDYTALVMVANDEYWIWPALQAPLQILPRVIVAVNNCTDHTLHIVRSLQAQYPNLELWDRGTLNPAQLGALRVEMSHAVQTKYGITIDGDEFYSLDTLRQIVAIDLPPDKQTGFITIFELGAGLSVVGAYPAPHVLRRGVTYQHDFPWEHPATFGQPETYYYFPPTLYCWHFHELQRSRHDATTYLRLNIRRQLPPLYQPCYLQWLPDFTPGPYPNPYWQEAPEPPANWQEDMVTAIRQSPIFAPVFEKGQ